MASTKKNVTNAVFIMLDTLQFNYLGCYGNTWVKTPNIDRLARNSVLFENAYSEGLPTVPVRRALMTGRFTLPFAGWQPLSPEDTTVADIFWGRDCQTALVYDTPPLRLPKYGYSRGFDYVKFCPGHELDHKTFVKRPLDPGLKAEDFTSPTMVYNDKGELIDDDSTSLLNEIDCFLRQTQGRRDESDTFVGRVMGESIRWINDIRDKDRPFFLWVDSFDPHEPWEPPSVWKGEPCPYDPDYQGNPLMLAPWTEVEGRITDRECEHIRALYAEKITLVDKWVGKLLDNIRDQGIWDETLIVLMSDHGQPMGKGEHGHGIMRKSRPWPYEELAHVPLIIHMPGVEPRRVPALVQNVDVTATIFDALGDLTAGKIEYGYDTFDSSDFQGHSLLPLMRGEVDSVRDWAIAGYYGKSWSLITEDYTFIHWLGSNAQDTDIRDWVGTFEEMKEEMWTCTAGAKVVLPEHDEMYDRKTDPFQLHNIIDQHPEKATELLQQLKLVIGELRTS